jgi:hypothetical protein
MMYAPAQHVEMRNWPSYSEIADIGIRRRYQITEDELISSGDGSEYVRSKIALIELDKTLKRLASLPGNWDSYGSEAPSPTAVSNAAILAKAFIGIGLIPDAVTASAEGGIAICFMRDQKYADVECFNSGEVLAVRYSSHENPKAWVIQPNAVADDASLQIFSTYLSA